MLNVILIGKHVQNKFLKTSSPIQQNWMPTIYAAQLELCISEVGQWMAASRLKLNTDKTELI